MAKPKHTARAAWSVIRKRPRTAIAAGASLVVVLLALVAIALLARRNAGPADMAVTEPLTTSPPAPVEPAPRPTTIVSFEDGCLTPACHASFSHATSLHAPVSDDACQTCHAPDTGNHTFPLLADAVSLCTSCHDMGAAKPFQHQAMTESGCLACHDPHTSSGPFLLAASTVARTCVQCHPAAKGSSVHPPYATGECLACHDPHASNNPRMLLAGPGADHCGHCHQTTLADMETAAYSHLAVENECLACHAPHASNHAALLEQSAGDLCVSCHEDVRQAVADATVTHDAVLTGRLCLTCHAPHQSDNAMMLLADQAEMCLQCHAEPVKTHDGRTVPNMSAAIKDAPFVHGPVKSNQCSACHAVHGAQFARLLREVNPEILVGPFNLQNYALCFSCHTQNLVLEERTTVATDFRNGDRNLHYVHVKKGDRARSCGSCHRVHGSDLPRLMADSVDFQGSGWIMPVKFEASIDGGSCAPGCHEPLAYSRSALAPEAGANTNGGPR